MPYTYEWFALYFERDFSSKRCLYFVKSKLHRSVNCTLMFYSRLYLGKKNIQPNWGPFSKKTKKGCQSSITPLGLEEGREGPLFHNPAFVVKDKVSDEEQKNTIMHENIWWKMIWSRWKASHLGSWPFTAFWP